MNDQESEGWVSTQIVERRPAVDDPVTRPRDQVKRERCPEIGTGRNWKQFHFQEVLPSLRGGRNQNGSCDLTSDGS